MSFSKSFIRTARQIFVLSDTDGNGYISTEELNVLIQYLVLRGAPEITPDCEKDYNGEINFEEFSHCLFHHFVETTTDDGSVNLALSALDRDGNGEIDS